MNTGGGEEEVPREEKRMTRMKMSNSLFLQAWLRERIFRSEIIGVHYIHSKYNLKCKTPKLDHFFLPLLHQWGRFQSYSNRSLQSMGRVIRTASACSPARRLGAPDPCGPPSGWCRGCCANNRVQGPHVMGSLLSVLLLTKTFWDEVLDVFLVALQPTGWTGATYCEMSLFYLNPERALVPHVCQLSFLCHSTGKTHLILVASIWVPAMWNSP